MSSVGKGGNFFSDNMHTLLDTFMVESVAASHQVKFSKKDKTKQKFFCNEERNMTEKNINLFKI